MKKSSKFFVCLIILILTIFLVGLFPGKILTFLVNSITGYNLSCDKVSLDALHKGRIEGLSFKIPDNNTTITSDRGEFNFSVSRFFKNREIEGRLILKEVAFSVEKVVPSEGLSLENLFFMPFSSGQKYREISFGISLNKQMFRISNFSADSDNVRIAGEYTLFKKKNEISVDVKISFSPNAAEVLDKNLIDNVLSRDDDGWYSTVIDYKGNPAFLMALYSLTTK
ncbi:MAG: hypothetical protein ABH862_05335 [Candidatus Omnitrophota bacterium]